jgi:hypothetical protein
MSGTLPTAQINPWKPHPYNGHSPRPREMKKSQLLSAIQNEIQRHNLSTFMSEKDNIVLTGCSTCRKHFGTVEQFKFHITNEVL